MKSGGFKLMLQVFNKKGHVANSVLLLFFYPPQTGPNCVRLRSHFFRVAFLYLYIFLVCDELKFLESMTISSVHLL
jgi:hypothetical protein